MSEETPDPNLWIVHPDGMKVRRRQRPPHAASPNTPGEPMTNELDVGSDPASAAAAGRLASVERHDGRATRTAPDHAPRAIVEHPQESTKAHATAALPASAGTQPSQYAVGYRKPPVHTRFQPQRSGNPKGRPRRAPDLRALVAEELTKKVHVREGGKARRSSKANIIATQLVNKAASGDARATDMLIKQFVGSATTPRTGDAMSGRPATANPRILEDFIAKIRGAPPEALPDLTLPTAKHRPTLKETDND